MIQITKNIYLVTISETEKASFNPKVRYIKKWFVSDSREECSIDAYDLLVGWRMRSDCLYLRRVESIEERGKVEVEEDE